MLEEKTTLVSTMPSGMVFMYHGQPYIKTSEKHFAYNLALNKTEEFMSEYATPVSSAILTIEE